VSGVARLEPDPERGGAPRVPPELALLTELAETSDAAGCAERALDWLTLHAGARRALVLGVDRGRRRLRCLAGRGLPAGIDPALEVDLDERGHPLVAALAGKELTIEPYALAGPSREGDPSAREGAVPHGLEGPPFEAFPLGEPDGTSPELGLLLAAGVGDRAPLRLAAQLLGMRLAALALPGLDGQLERRRREVEWLSGILEAVTDPVLLTDSDGRTLVANSHAEKLLSADDQMSEGRRRAVALNNMLFSASLFTAGDEPGATRREVLLVDPIEGGDLMFELIGSRLRVGPGETGTVSLLRNITDLRRATEEIEEQYHRLHAAEAKTRAERDRLDLILNAVIDPVVVTDPSGNIARMNPPAERLFTSAEAEGDDAERRVRANDAVFTSFISNLYASQSLRQRGELALTDPGSGDRVPVEAISGKVLSQHGEETAVVTILHDLTEAMEKARLYEQVKRHSEELEERVREATGELAEQNELLRRQTLELAEASRLKDQFLANVSHELRTPLNAVLGYTSLLLQGVFGELPDEQRQRLERVDSNGRHLLAIINDLLDVARIEAGKMPVELERFALAGLVDEVMVEVEPLIEKSGLDVSRDVGPDLPELESDRQKVKQILINLLSNALKFTEVGAVAIRARRTAGGRRVAVSVADTGVGISDEHQRTIFEAFGQTGTAVARTQGTGLGLSICRRLATVLGGDIELESVEGEGSTFTLILPLHREDPTPTAEEA